MGLIDFVKNAGAKVFGYETDAMEQERGLVKGSALENHVRSIGFDIEGLRVDFKDEIAAANSIYLLPPVFVPWFRKEYRQDPKRRYCFTSCPDRGGRALYCAAINVTSARWVCTSGGKRRVYPWYRPGMISSPYFCFAAKIFFSISCQ